MRRLLLLTLVPVLSLAFLAVCGDDDNGGTAAGNSTTSTTAAPSSTTTTGGASSTSTSTASGAADVKVASSSLGDILVDSEGRTLYAFKNDTAGTPTCTGGCAGAWPAATVAGTPKVDPKVAAGVITTVQTADGKAQLKAKTQPLYLFSGDSKAGDMNGQGVNNFVAVKADGSLTG